MARRKPKKKKDKKKQQNTRDQRIRSQFGSAAREAKDTLATTTTLIISALTLVAGLAWNQVASALFGKLQEKLSGWGEIVGLVIYASLVTFVVVLIVQRLKKIQERIWGKSIK
jgi:F0F1-type ATP synthase assembly protein I